METTIPKDLAASIEQSKELTQVDLPFEAPEPEPKRKRRNTSGTFLENTATIGQQDEVEAFKATMKARLSSLEDRAASLRSVLTETEAKADKIRRALIAIGGPDLYEAKQAGHSGDARRRTAKKAPTAKRAKGTTANLTKALRARWCSFEELERVTGWKRTSLQPVLSKLKAKRRKAPTDENPKAKEYRL